MDRWMDRGWEGVTSQKILTDRQPDKQTNRQRLTQNKKNSETELKRGRKCECEKQTERGKNKFKKYMDTKSVQKFTDSNLSVTLHANTRHIFYPQHPNFPLSLFLFSSYFFLPLFAFPSFSPLFFLRNPLVPNTLNFFLYVSELVHHITHANSPQMPIHRGKKNPLSAYLLISPFASKV